MLQIFHKSILRFAALFALFLPFSVHAAGTFVQQTQNSVAAPITSVAAPSITTTAGNALVIAVLTTLGDASTINDGGIGNTYTLAGTVSGGAFELQLFYAQNIHGGATVFTANATDQTYAIYVAEYSGLATSGLFINFAGNSTSGSEGTGANAITSGTVTNSASAMLFGFTVSTNGNAGATAGTSPIAFTGRGGVWAAFSGSTTVTALAEDAPISGNAAATFGAGNQFDAYFTVAMALAVAPAPPPAIQHHRPSPLGA
jgi:hypothetical protein